MTLKKNGHSREEAAIKHITNESNIAKDPETCTSIAHIERDAKAMVHIFNRIQHSSNLTPFERIYETLRKLHGDQFDTAFSNCLKGGE